MYMATGIESKQRHLDFRCLNKQMPGAVVVDVWMAERTLGIKIRVLPAHVREGHIGGHAVAPRGLKGSALQHLPLRLCHNVK